MRSYFSWLLLVIICCFALASCGGSGNDTTAQQSDTTLLTSSVIFPQGGTVEVLDEETGEVIVAVEIPANALSEEQTITISKTSLPASMVAGSSEAGATYQFGPEGLSFNLPVLMTLPFNDPNNDGTIEGTTTADNDVGVRYYNEQTGLWEDMAVVSLDRTLNTVTFSTDHFSAYTPWIPVINEIPETTQLPPGGGITVDGDPSDWSTLKPLRMDAPNDVTCSGAEPGMDLRYVYTAMDSQYVYLMIQMHDGPINQKLTVDLRSSLRWETNDLQWSAYADIQTGFDAPGTDIDWGSYGQNAIDLFYGYSAAAPLPGHELAWGEVLEARIPLSDITFPDKEVVHFNPVKINLTYGNRENICDTDGYYPNISWFQPIHRNDAVKGIYDYIGFMIENRNGEGVYDNVVVDATLTNPSGAQVNVFNDVVYDYSPYILGSYELGTDSFIYQPFTRKSAFYVADIDTMELGEYKLSVYDKFGNEFTRLSKVTEITEYPYVDISTINAEYDALGNLTLTWTPPDLPPDTTINSIRAALTGKSNGTSTQYIEVRWIPLDVTRMEVPVEVLDFLREGSDELVFKLGIRNQTGDSRAYSYTTIPFQ